MKDKPKDIPLKVLKAGNLICTIYGRDYGYIVSEGGQKIDSSKGAYLQINLGVTNLNNKTIVIDTTVFKLTSITGQSYPYADTMDKAMRNFQHSLQGVVLKSGETQKGFIVFSVPDIDNYRLGIYSEKEEKAYLVFEDEAE